MPYKPASGGSEPGTKSGGGLRGSDRQQRDLQDRRRGAYEHVVPPAPEPMKEHRTNHEDAQPGADVRSETEPPNNELPQRLRRQKKNK